MALDWQHPGVLAVTSAWLVGLVLILRRMANDLREAQRRQRARLAAGRQLDDGDRFWPRIVTALLALLIAATLMGTLTYVLTSDHDGRHERQEDGDYVEP